MDVLTTLGGACRYEFVMQLRRRSIWLVLLIVTVPIFLLWVPYVGDPQTPERELVLSWTQFFAWFLPVGVGLVLADRLARDQKLHVDELLDTCASSLTSRLAGKYLGSTLATLLPTFLLYLIGVLYTLIYTGHISLFLLALEAFVAIPLPGILFAAGFSIAMPAIVKVPVYQILFVGYWFWANLMSPRFGVPTLVGTMLNATGPWAQEGLFHYQWVFLILHPTVWQSIESIALLIGLGFIGLIAGSIYLHWEHARR